MTFAEPTEFHSKKSLRFSKPSLIVQSAQTMCALRCHPRLLSSRCASFCLQGEAPESMHQRVPSSAGRNHTACSAFLYGRKMVLLHSRIQHALHSGCEATWMTTIPRAGPRSLLKFACLYWLMGSRNVFVVRDRGR